MKVEDVYEYFGNSSKAAMALNITKQSISNWIKRGFIPIEAQKRLAKLSKGALKVDNGDRKPEESQRVFFPAFRYHDAKHGACDVQSITFRKNAPPKITYSFSKDGREKTSTFNTEPLMQALDYVDKHNKRVYVGDELQLKDRRKIKILGIGAKLLDLLDRSDGYYIIDNTQEGK